MKMAQGATNRARRRSCAFRRRGQQGKSLRPKLEVTTTDSFEVEHDHIDCVVRVLDFDDSCVLQAGGLHEPAPRTAG